MDNDVSVARLSDDDWNERTPPGPRSRIRLLAVMGAVVVGCVVAAVAVNLVPDDGVQRADDRGDRIVVIDPDRTELYPTTGGPAPTTDGDRVVVTEVTDLSQDGDTSSPQDGTPGGDGGDLDDPGGENEDTEVPGDDDTTDDRRDEDDQGDENDEDTDDTTSPGPSGTGTPAPTSSPSATSTSPTTTPPGEDEEDKGCSPWWWPACW